MGSNLRALIVTITLLAHVAETLCKKATQMSGFSVKDSGPEMGTGSRTVECGMWRAGRCDFVADVTRFMAPRCRQHKSRTSAFFGPLGSTVAQDNYDS